MRSKSRGPTTRIPGDWLPSKFCTLKITIVRQPAATASSKTMSYFGSGLQRSPQVSSEAALSSEAPSRVAVRESARLEATSTRIPRRRRASVSSHNRRIAARLSTLTAARGVSTGWRRP